MLLAKLTAVFALVFLLALEPFQFEFAGQTDPKGEAYLVLIANEDMPSVQVTIKGDGQTIRRTVPGMRAGSKKKLTWKQNGKVADYDLEIRGGDMETTFRFQVAKASGAGGKQIGQLAVLSSREEIVKGRKVRYRTPSPLTNIEYKVYDTSGDVIADQLLKQEVAAGGTFEIKWTVPGEVFMVHVKGEDDYGGFTEYKLVPWSVEIPHTEVNFDSNKFDIKGDQEWKVKEAMSVAFHELEGLDKVNKAVGANITPKLYIVGYTDTVGPANKNQVLSENRARQIAQYFYDHGFWAEIYYAGMGERGLRVATDDQVDEVRNRRALYLLTVQQPGAGGQIPGSWKKLAAARSRPANFELPPLPEKWKNYKEDKDGAHDGGGQAGGGTESAPDSSDPAEREPTDADADMGATEYGGEDGPPSVEGEPGATRKGCSQHAAAPGTGVPAFLLSIVPLVMRRRRRPVAASG